MGFSSSQLEGLRASGPCWSLLLRELLPRGLSMGPLTALQQASLGEQERASLPGLTVFLTSPQKGHPIPFVGLCALKISPIPHLRRRSHIRQEYQEEIPREPLWRVAILRVDENLAPKLWVTSGLRQKNVSRALVHLPQGHSFTLRHFPWETFWLSLN